ALQLVRRAFEFSETFSEGLAEFRQFAGPKNNQSDHENDDQLRHSNRTQHDRPAFRKTRRWTTAYYRNRLAAGSRRSPLENAQKFHTVRKLSATMRVMRRIRPASAVAFVLVVSAIIGGLYGRRALAVDDKIPEHYKTFTAALSAIESQYVD